MHKIPWDFEIQTDDSILARRPDLMLKEKEQEKKPVIEWILPFQLNIVKKKKKKKKKKINIWIANIIPVKNDRIICTFTLREDHSVVSIYALRKVLQKIIIHILISGYVINWLKGR